MKCILLQCESVFVPYVDNALKILKRQDHSCESSFIHTIEIFDAKGKVIFNSSLESINIAILY